MKFNGLIVVEGKSDIDFLSSFIEADFYPVNGSAVSKIDYDFINEYSKNKDVVILTDPDFPGLQIREKINNHCPNVKNAFIRKEFSIKKHKVGVAESTKEEVIYGLTNLVNFDSEKSLKNFIKIEDLYELGLMGKENSFILRKKVSEDLHLGFTNSKTFLKRLNMVGVNKERLIEVINNVKQR